MDKLLDSKRTYIANDGEEYIDMCIPTVDLNSVQRNATYRVTEEQSGRIDKATFMTMGIDVDAIDIFMYANHIFNPFAINEDDVVYSAVNNSDIYSGGGEPQLPDGGKYSQSLNGKKEMTYAEKVEAYARKGGGAS